jgi:hypothetical protein
MLCAFSGATALMRSAIGPILADTEARTFLQQLLGARPLYAFEPTPTEQGPFGLLSARPNSEG